MSITKEEVESLYSRVPILRPPPSVFVLQNASVGADYLYDATHKLNAIAREERWHILGFHEMGTPFILVAGDAPPLTALHEAVHYNGVRNEQATRAIARALYARSRFNLGLRSRPVSYSAMPVDTSERDSFLRSMRLSTAPGETREVELLHLVYTP